MERVDYDGRATGLEVYQWQPQAKLWCRPNEYACGLDLELIGYRYVGPCKRPLFQQEKDDLKALILKLDTVFRSSGEDEGPVEEITLTRKDYDALRSELSDLY